MQGAAVHLSACVACICAAHSWNSASEDMAVPQQSSHAPHMEHMHMELSRAAMSAHRGSAQFGLSLVAVLLHKNTAAAHVQMFQNPSGNATAFRALTSFGDSLGARSLLKPITFPAKIWGSIEVVKALKRPPFAKQ